MEHHHTETAVTIKSSFANIDSEKLFKEIRLKEGDVFLDLACGSGDYSIATSRITGANGKIYALDLWEEGIEIVKKKASEKGIENIIAQVLDAGTGLPIEDKAIDVCLIASAFHDLLLTKVADGIMKEIIRVLKSQGILGIVEYKTMVTPGELEQIVIPYGLKKELTTEIGSSHYLSVFRAC